MEITEEKKIIPAKTVVKALITGFVSYGIVIGFLLFTIALVVNTFVYNIPNANQKVLAFSLPLLFAFILYFSIHSICRLSTSDLFNKCKTESNEELTKITSKMNLFFLICVITLVIISNSLLMLKLSNERKSIDIASQTYSTVFSENFTSNLTNEMLADYNEKKNQTLASAIILELSLVVSFISLIPYQKKMILEYNDSGKRVKLEE